MVWPNSPRNEPTGPGSRGGHWHDPEFRRAYQRKWRALHPTASVSGFAATAFGMERMQ